MTSALSWLPTGILVLLLLIATSYGGAFALRHWAPVAILALSVVAASIWSGASSLGGRGPRVAVICIFGFAGWGLASALWSNSPGLALTGGARDLLYASLFFVAVATPSDRRSAARLAGGLMVGVTLIAVVTLGGILLDGPARFLAGRLDDPVGYRNATACLFAFAFWPLICVVARRALNPFLRGGAFAGAVLSLGLAFLTQARGVGLGLVLGGIVAIGLGPDRLRRVWVALLAGGAIAAISGPLLTPYDAFVDGQPQTASDINAAAVPLLIVTGIGLLAALGIALVDGGLRGSPRARGIARRISAGVLAVFGVLAVASVLAAVGNPVTFAQDRIDDFRGLETAAPGETRLTFAGGQRADLWNVALDEFKEHPVAGVGEGGYQAGYYLRRENDRNLSTPHSLVFEVLAEKGLVGAALLLGMLLAVAVTVARRWRAAEAQERWVASGLLAAGVVVLGQGTVDWIWLIPGVTGLAFIAFGLAIASLTDHDRRGVLARPARIAAAAAVAVLAAGVTALYASDIEVRAARDAVDAPQRRLDAARNAARLNPFTVTPKFLEASAHEDLGQTAQARQALLDARRLEPESFVPLGLLGDLELRAGRERQAGRWYRRALALNPLDSGLRMLVRRTR